MSQQDAQDRFAAGAHSPFPRASAHRNRGAETPPDDRLDRLIDRLPKSWQTAVRWLRRPASRWARIPAGLLLIAGGCLASLPEKRQDGAHPGGIASDRRRLPRHPADFRAMDDTARPR